MLLELREVSFAYNRPGSTKKVLSGINLAVEAGEFTAVIGPSGSGKSTLLLHFNGLLRPTSGRVSYLGRDIHGKGFDLKGLRREVGMLFQFPEGNLFGQTVFEDVAYGPANHGLAGKDLNTAVEKALETAGLDSGFKSRSPFSLSGGEKRKVALAGLLAMEPKVLLLDEPTAGLDPGTRGDFLAQLKSLNANGITVVMISHDLEEVTTLAERVIVLADGGKIQADGSARDILASADLEKWDMETPDVIKLGRALKLRYNGLPVISEEEAVKAILEAVQKQV